MTKHGLTYAITLIVAFTSIFAPPAAAHFTTEGMLQLQQIWGIGVPDIRECLAVISDVPGCLEELLSSIFSFRPRLLGPVCCNALLQADQNCWPRVLPIDPNSPQSLKEYCVDPQTSPGGRAPPVPPPPPPAQARAPPPPPPAQAHTPPPPAHARPQAQAPPPTHARVPPPPRPSVLAQALPTTPLPPARAQTPSSLHAPLVPPPIFSLPAVRAQTPPSLNAPSVPPSSSSLPTAHAQAPPSLHAPLELPLSSLPPSQRCPSMTVPPPMSIPNDYDEYGFDV